MGTEVAKKDACYKELEGYFRFSDVNVFAYKKDPFRFEKAQAGWDVWRGTHKVGWVAVRDHAKPFVDELLAREEGRTGREP